MNPLLQRFVTLVSFIAVTPLLAAQANAPGLADQLQQLTAQLQQSPGDQALREKIIAQALTINPRPATPDAATMAEGAAEYAFKNAKAESDYSNAAKQYEKALVLAPWLAADYFNCGVAYEKAGDNKEDIRSFSLYLLAAPNADDALAVKKRIGGLQYAAQKATDEANSPAVQLAKLIQSLDGGVWMGDSETLRSTPEVHERRIFEIRNGLLIRKVVTWYNGQAEPDPSQYVAETDHVALTGRRLTYRSNDIAQDCNPVTDDISDSGNTITESHSCYGREVTTTYVRSR